MKITFLASEAVPYAKTGGLADVVGALPRYLHRMGIDVALFLPLYRDIKEKSLPMNKISEVRFPWQNSEAVAPVWEHQENGVRAFFLQNDAYYDRDGIYGTPGGDHPDNGERFAFYSRASLEAMKAVGFQPAIIHAHDWQAALSLAYLKYVYRDDPFFREVRTLFTVHNLAYQGIFPPEIIERVGLPRDVFRLEEMEFYGRANFLKAGLVYATALSTVSPTYSREIQEPEHGCGLDGVLRQRAAVLFGILNGIDPSVWNPETDPFLPHHFSSENLSGKKKCKQELFRHFSLPLLSIDQPLAGMVSRLADQKGLDILTASLDGLFSLGLHVVILGQGDKKYHELLEEQRSKYPGRLGLRIAFDEGLAHLIIAGSDLFLIPSRFEPCGLTQMYSLRYGTAPVVRATGGLADTVEEFNPRTLRGTGFKFREYSAQSLVAAVEKAVHIFNQPSLWSSLIRNAMAADFSWERSARSYLELYQKILSWPPQ